MRFLFKRKSQSTMNLLTVQIQELQDKVNSLSNAREFYDPWTASSSGLSHVSSHPTRIPSPHGMLSRDLCLQPGTRNSIGISGNAVEDLHAPNEPSAAFFGNSWGLASAQWEPVSLNAGRLAARANELERNSQNFAVQHRDLQGSFQLGILPLLQKELIRRNAWLTNQRIKTRKCISINSPILLHSSVLKTSFKTEVCSHFPTEAMLWIKEVEMVRSTDDLQTSRSIRDHQIFGTLRCLMRR